MITSFEVGDIFKERDSKNLYLILDYNDDPGRDSFLYSGCNGNLEKMYGGSTRTKNGILNQLNSCNCTKIGSIKDFKITQEPAKEDDISVWGFKNKI